MKCKYLNNPAPHIVPYEVYSFARIVSDYFSVNSEEVIFFAREVLPEKVPLFGTNTRYEDVVIGIIHHILERDCLPESIPTDITDYIRQLYPSDSEYEHRIIKVYHISRILVDLFHCNVYKPDSSTHC